MEIAQQIVSLMAQGKKDDIKKLYPLILEEMPWMKGML